MLKYQIIKTYIGYWIKACHYIDNWTRWALTRKGADRKLDKLANYISNGCNVVKEGLIDVDR